MFDVIAAVKGITYKPGWIFAVHLYGRGDLFKIHIRHEATDPLTGLKVWPEAWDVFHAYMSDAHELFPIFIQVMVRKLEMHETDEWLKYNGQHIQEPH